MAMKSTNCLEIFVTKESYIMKNCWNTAFTSASFD